MKHQNLRAIGGERKVALLFGAFAALVFLLLLGALTAVAPNLVVRVLPVPVMIVVALMAGFSRRAEGVRERFAEYWLSTLVLVFVLWPSYMIFKFGGLPAIDGRKLLAGLSLLMLLFLLINRRKNLNCALGDKDKPTKVMCVTVLGYVGFRLLSGFLSPSPVATTIAVGWDVLYYYGIFFLTIAVFCTPRTPRIFALLMIFLVAALGLFAVVERMTGRNVLLDFAPRSVAFEDFSAALSVTRFRDGVFRAQGTFEHPLLLSEFSSIATCFALAYALWEKGVMRWLSLAALFAGLVALILSGSRSGYLAGGGAVMIVFWLWALHAKKPLGQFSSRQRVLMFAGGLILAAILAVPLLTLLAQGRTVSESTSTEARRVMLERGIPSIIAHPIFGSGPGESSDIAGITTGSGIHTLDNYLLSIAIDSGLPAVVLFLISLLYPAWKASVFVLSRPSKYAPFAAASVGAFFAVLVMRCFLWMPYNLSLVYTMMGLLLWVVRERNGGQEVLL